MDLHVEGAWRMANSRVCLTLTVVEDAYVELSPMDQQKALQYEEALRNKVQRQ